MVLGQAYASGRGVKQDISGQKAPPFPTIFGKKLRVLHFNSNGTVSKDVRLVPI